MTTYQDILEAIQTHGQATYPEECCGFLLGHPSPEGNHIVESWPVTNRQAENRTRRYVISPLDYLQAEREARQKNLDIVGFYHSHPDHPAHPSATDLAEATFAGFSYVIVSIQQGQPAETTSWLLAPDRSRFDSEPITLHPSSTRAL